jgi:glucose uptake protein GlcU
MSELYWITRLDAVCGIIATVIAFAFIFMVVGFMAFVICANEQDKEREKEQARNILRYSLIIFLVSIFMYVFTPDTKQALIIYGVGGTIDYVKSNDKAKQLPDKVIDALDKYLDSIDKGGEK